MTWFRNVNTGREFELNGRLADALRGDREVQEIEAPGGDATTPAVAAVSESDPALRTLRKADLEALATDMGLDATGSKSELIARISSRSGGTVGAAVYQDPTPPLNPQPDTTDLETAGDLPADIEAAVAPAAEPGGTVGAPIYREPAEPLNPDPTDYL